VRKTGGALCYLAPDTIVPLDIADARDISLGYTQEDRRYTVCMLRADRTVACIDDADGTFAYAPLRDVDDLRDVRGVAVGGGFACAVVGDGTVSCWGDNRAGQLGDGTLTQRRRPAPVVGIHDAIAISAGSSHACALHRDGTVSCWGDATAGQLGTFATSSIDEPQHVDAFDD
jgi:alpha-tubulin suppressor-like RCC1 family protein